MRPPSIGNAIRSVNTPVAILGTGRRPGQHISHSRPVATRRRGALQRRTALHRLTELSYACRNAAGFRGTTRPVMTFARLCFACLLFLLPAPASAVLGAEAERPNFLWLIAEDLGPHLGCWGTQQVWTPNLDRLAAEGVRYTHCFTTAPVCSPSRSAFMTGLYQ